MALDFHTLSSRVLDDCLQLGAKAAEVYYKTGGSCDIKLHQGKVATVVSAEEEGVGIRFVLPGGRMGYAYTSDVSPKSVAQVIEEAMRGSEEGDGREPLPGFPGAVAALPGEEALAIYDPELRKTPVSQKVELVWEIEAATLGSDGRVLWVDTLIYHDGWAEMWLRNTAGFMGRYRRTLCHAVLSVLARAGSESILSYHTVASPLAASLDPKSVGAEAGRRATAALGGRPVSPRRVTVVLEPQVTARVLEFLAPSLLAEAHHRGRSLFNGKLGREVASPCVTIVDDGRLRSGVSTSPFDGEGTPTQRTVVVEQGTLRRLLHDRGSAQRERDAASTGNAVRNSFTEAPALGVTNLMIEPSRKPLDEVLPIVGEAFRVTSIRTGGGVNPSTGSFSVGASGAWIQRGDTVFPVAGVTLSGDLGEMVRHVVAVGDDLRWEHGRGSFGAPTIVIEGMTVAG